MDPFRVRLALSEVARLKSAILEKQRLRGFSGRGRLLGGLLALAGGWGYAWLPIVPTSSSIFLLWSAVFALAWIINYAGPLRLLFFSGQPTEPSALRAHLETLPAWLAGGVLTIALYLRGETELLYGVWMLLFGLMQTSSRRLLPKDTLWVGLYYLAAGTVCLALPFDVYPLTPLMGTVFFVGEFLAALVFHADGDWSRLTSPFKPSSRVPPDRENA